MESVAGEEQRDVAMLVKGPSSKFLLHLKCRCGRDLRARPGQAGTEIICWDCHAPVWVPVPVAPGGWVARLLRMGARQVLEARTIVLLTVGAVLVTLGLSLTDLGVGGGSETQARLPTPGIWAAAIALALVSIGYGELLRRGSQGDWTPRPRISRWARAWRAMLCLGVGVALVLPLVFASAQQTAPRATANGLAIGLVACLIFPLVMFGTYAPSGTIRDRVRVVLVTLYRHPLAVLASLLILPGSLVVIEVGLIMLTRSLQTFSFLLIDLFPPHELVRVYSHTPHILNVDFRFAPDSSLFGIYGESLKQGYGLIGAIPASLAVETSRHIKPALIMLTSQSYLIHRMLYTLFIVASMLTVLAVQARWLGLLSTMDTRRTLQDPTAPPTT